MRRILLFARLGRFHSPTGANLLFWPCAWAHLLAAREPDWGTLGALWLGCVFARAAGCAWNDLLDRNLDARTRRGRTRPLASGALSPREGLLAAVLFVALAAVCGWFALTPLAWALVAAIVPVVALYPLAKRFTRAPQAVLGVAFSWGAPVAWTATTGALPAAPAWTLYAAAWTLTLAYDVAYAFQDAEDDRRENIGSLAVALGARAHAFVVAAACLAWALVVAAALLARAPAWVALALAPAGWLFVSASARMNPRRPADGARVFRRADGFGALVAVALLAARLGGG